MGVRVSGAFNGKKTSYYILKLTNNMKFAQGGRNFPGEKRELVWLLEEYYKMAYLKNAIAYE